MERDKTMSDWLDDLMGRDTLGTEPRKVMVSPGYTPPPPSAWGVKERPGHAVGAPPETVSEPVAETVETSPAPPKETPADVRKGPETPKSLKVPPKPAEPPVVPEVSKETETPEETETPDEETTGRIRAVVNRMREAKEVTKETVAKVTKPVREKVGGKVEAVKNEADPRQARKWGLLWSTAASWVVAPGTVGALYDRGVNMFGSWTDSFPRAAYLDAGGVPHEWDLLEGPAWWVKNTVGTAWEAGLTPDLLASAGVGIAPVLALTLLHTGDGGAWGMFVKAMRWFVMLGVAYYIGFEWFPQWWEVYLSALSAAAVYGWMMAKRLSSEFLAFLCRIPAAAIVSGTILYSPGAIF